MDCTDKRPRGRPRRYNEAEALDRAIEVFWKKGFDGTSLDDLGATTGMSRPSMYLAFGDKEQLFLKALDRFVQTVASEPLVQLEQTEGIWPAMKVFFTEVTRYATKNSAHLGCLLGPVACAVDLPSVRGYVVDAMQEMHTRLVQRLESAVAKGELPADFPVADRADLAINLILGLTMRARHGVPFEKLQQGVDEAVQCTLRGR